MYYTIYIDFSLSFIAFSSSAETYYGVLRGSKTILFKSPYQGVVNLSELREGEIKNNIALFEVKIMSMSINNTY